MSIIEGSQILYLVFVKNGDHVCLKDSYSSLTVGSGCAVLERALLAMNISETRTITFDRQDIMESLLMDMSDVDGESFIVTLTLVEILPLPTNYEDFQTFLDRCESSAHDEALHTAGGNVECSFAVARIRAEYNILAAMRNRGGVLGHSTPSTETHLLRPTSRSMDVLRCCVQGASASFMCPLWEVSSRRETFLPDLFRLARACASRLVVVIEGEVPAWARHVPVESDRTASTLTLNDVSMDVSVESECATTTGSVVLTWCRHRGPPQCRDMDDVLWGAEFDTDYRCAVLRVGGWGDGASLGAGQWAALQTLYAR